MVNINLVPDVRRVLKGSYAADDQVASNVTERGEGTGGKDAIKCPGLWLCTETVWVSVTHVTDPVNP